jgi:hypothetical protein
LPLVWALIWRYVIHWTTAETVEGFYQEWTRLFSSSADAINLQRKLATLEQMIDYYDDDDLSPTDDDDKDTKNTKETKATIILKLPKGVQRVGWGLGCLPVVELYAHILGRGVA